MVKIGTLMEMGFERKGEGIDIWYFAPSECTVVFDGSLKPELYSRYGNSHTIIDGNISMEEFFEQFLQGFSNSVRDSCSSQWDI